MLELRKENSELRAKMTSVVGLVHSLREVVGDVDDNKDRADPTGAAAHAADGAVRAVEVAAAAKHSRTVCEECDTDLKSRNALFKHLRTAHQLVHQTGVRPSGHAPPNPAETKDEEGGWTCEECSTKYVVRQSYN